MRLNFSNEALGESNDDILPLDQDGGGSNMALLNEFPSLKDLETSNMVTR